ncbi:MAG: type III pantothenate kinase, partial [Alphaproteobacteria bacterium]
MLLAIDSGNTNIVFAVFDGDVRRGEWRSSSRSERTGDEYAVWLTQLMTLEGLTRRDIDAAIVANVVPAASLSLLSLCRRYFDAEPLVVGEEGVALGIRVLVPDPTEVGADRLVNAVGAQMRYPGGQKVVIDFGTATTFDVVDGEGNYCGGAIAPGINLSLEALHHAAAKLPRIALRRPPKVVGVSTVPAMQSGVFWGYTGLVEGLVLRIAAERGERMTVIATGGLAPLFKGATDSIHHFDSELTMR